MRRAATAFAVLAVAGVAVHLGFAVAGQAGGAPVEDWLYGLLFAATSASCAWRAVRSPGERLPWALASAGVATWLAAEVVYRATESDPTAAYPPATRALLLLSFTLAATTIALLSRRRVREVEPRLLLDGLIGGLAVAAVAAIPLFSGETTAASQATPPALFLTADLAILAFVVVVTGLTGWRPGTGWCLIAGGIVLNTAGNCALVIQSASGNFQRGGPVDSLFVASALTLGVAAFFSVESSAGVQNDRGGCSGPRPSRWWRWACWSPPAPRIQARSRWRWAAPRWWCWWPGRSWPSETTGACSLAPSTRRSPTRSPDWATAGSSHGTSRCWSKPAMTTGPTGRWCCSTSTDSRPTTTPSATPPATRC